MITNYQRPFQLTPSNTDHIYSFSSDLTGNTDFRYVIDVYVDTTTSNPTKIARQIISPNTYGRGIINVQRIIENYVEGNARCEDAQYTSQNTSDTTPYGILSNLSGITTSNGYNGNVNYPDRYGVRDYRIIVGEQYTDTDGTTTTIISTDVSTPPSVFTSTLSNVPTLYSATTNTINWYGAGANIPDGSLLQPGVIYKHTNITQSIIYASGNTTTPNGVYTPTAAINGSLFFLDEKYTGIRYRYGWFSSPSYEGWVLQNIEYPEGYLFTFPPITIWPGTTLRQGSYTALSSNYWNINEPVEQQNYWELYNYRISGNTLTDENPNRFLTTFGDKLYNINNDVVAGDVYRIRRRRHHPQCPILVAFFNGGLQFDNEITLSNDIESVYVLTSPDQNQEYLVTGFTEFSNNNYTTLPPQNERIKYVNVIRPDLAGGKVGIWAGTSGEVGQWDIADIRSEFVEYYLEENNCLTDPVHILFLNRQGVFDTYTFDRKAVEEKSIERKTYSQGGIKDLENYAELSTQRRNVIYDQDIKVEMQVESWYLEDNDKPIIMDIFQSPEIYIIKDHNWLGKTEKSYSPYLLPVTLNANTITEYKNRYNKIFQYSFSFEYTPINYYRTQG